ncbi:MULTISPECIES: DUF554 domain-containing protein [unclassified Luteococcus]|uniref:DUF554 domain-containing protein n=1 Tax=unclassified Luteococcus TaxID=2639923 RepID=UPI00313D2422
MEFLQHGFIGVGTAVNVLLIVLGSLAGLALGGRLSQRTAATITDVLSLVVLVIGALSVRPLLQPTLNEAVGNGAALVVILLALVVGALIGSVLRLEERMDDLGRWIRGRVGAEGDHRFVDGFVTATLVFCVGPLSILGALSDGLGRGSEQLLVKAVLDGFASVAFASSLGVGVMLSAVAVALYQGTLTIVGALLGDVLPPAQIDALTVAGGVILMALAVRLMGLKPLRVADMLPALVCAPLFVWFVQLAS